MANIKDFAVGIVQTAPSPATSGTTLTLRPGEGSTMPTPPFYGTATPPGQITSLSTSEKLLVTNVSGDTLTIVRGQSPTSAKAISQGWIFANAMYVDDVYKSSIFTDELLTGTVNGTNKVFTTANGFSQIQVYKNGVAMHISDDFTITGANQVTFVTAPATGSKLTATYITGSQAMIAGSNSQVFSEIPMAATGPGGERILILSRPYIAGTTRFYINGLKQKPGVHYTETNPALGQLTIAQADVYETGSDLMVDYQFVQSVSGNADTLDGFHASSTPAVGQLYPLVAKTTDANGWTVYDYGLWKEYTKLVAVNKLIASGGFGDETITTNLPSAMATLGSATVIASILAASDPQQFVVGIKASSTSTSLILAVKNIYTTSVTLAGDIHVRILG